MHMCENKKWLKHEAAKPPYKSKASLNASIQHPSSSDTVLYEASLFLMSVLCNLNEKLTAK